MTASRFFATGISRELLRKVLVIVLWSPAILFWVTAVVAHLPIVSAIADFISPLIILILVIGSYPVISKSIRLRDIGLYLIGAFLVGFTYSFFPSNEEFLDEWVYVFLIQTLPFLFLGLIIDFDKDKDWLYYASLFSVLITVVYNLVVLNRRGAIQEDLDNMNASYGLLPHLLYVIWYMFKKVSVLNVLTTIVGTYMLISFGTRGPVFFLVVFVVLFFLFVSNISHKLWVRVLLIIAAAGFILFFNPVMEALDESLASRGLSVRVVDSVVNGDTETDLSLIERSYISKRLIDHLGNSFAGLGIAGTYTIVGTYAHNIVIDMLVDFGWIGGGILIVIMVLLFIRSFIYTHKTEVQMFYIILLLCGFACALISMTYLSNRMLYVLIGFSIATVRRHGRIKSIS